MQIVYVVLICSVIYRGTSIFYYLDDCLTCAFMCYMIVEALIN